MKRELTTATSAIDPTELTALLQRDGAAIVEGALEPEQLDSLNAELDGVVAATGPGLRHPTEDRMEAFYGNSTIRFDGLPAKSKTFLDVMESSLLTKVADQLLLPNCHDYLLNTGQLIQIGPGETAQLIHRDEDAWRFIQNPTHPLEVEAMFALDDFTLANGATRVVPGSHLWSAERIPDPHEIVQAEMTAGSALIYLGSTLHGGGANTTTDEWRRGMFLGFVVGWLRTEENTFLTVPLDTVRDMPVRCQELLGYKAHEAIGVVDVGSPMALLGANS